MKTIPLTQGKFAIVDDEDFEKLNVHKWHLQKSANFYYYAVRRKNIRGKEIAIYMHREILGLRPTDNQVVDHIDHEGLNNRRFNIRICTNQENRMNSKHNKNSLSKFKGVSWHKHRRKWYASIKVNGRSQHLGSFDSEIEAAKVYDSKAKKLCGEFACTNF